MAIVIDILFEQRAVLVINKPAGLLTQAPPGIDSLELRLRKYLTQRDQAEGRIYLGVPHRLDRPVSGAITMVRNVRAAQRISKQIQDHTVQKIYWAVVEGVVPEDQGTWIDWMRKLPDEARSEVVAPDHPDAKEAVLSYRVLGRSYRYSWLEIELQTGRTHQIRLQASSRGFPIVGDQLYGSTESFGEPMLDTRKAPIALHARRLAFEHPIEHSLVDVVAPLNDNWNQFTDFQAQLFASAD